MLITSWVKVNYWHVKKKGERPKVDCDSFYVCAYIEMANFLCKCETTILLNTIIFLSNELCHYVSDFSCNFINVYPK